MMIPRECMYCGTERDLFWLDDGGGKLICHDCAVGLVAEKEHRIYYQDIVYHVCNVLDKISGKTKAGHTVCPACGRELIAEKSDDIEVAPEILEDTEAAKEGVFE